MGSISATYEIENDLTIVTATGKLNADDFHTWMVKYYAGQITSLILWDLTGADLSGFTNSEVRVIAQHTKQISNARKGGKTALVFAEVLEFGMGRMFEAYSEIEQMPFEFRTFQSFDKAREWLGI